MTDFHYPDSPSDRRCRMPVRTCRFRHRLRNRVINAGMPPEVPMDVVTEAAARQLQKKQ
jgi:hypothetical protein